MPVLLVVEHFDISQRALVACSLLVFANGQYQIGVLWEVNWELENLLLHLRISYLCPRCTPFLFTPKSHTCLYFTPHCLPSSRPYLQSDHNLLPTDRWQCSCRASFPVSVSQCQWAVSPATHIAYFYYVYKTCPHIIILKVLILEACAMVSHQYSHTAISVTLDNPK